MSLKGKKFADDGWAVWLDGDDTSTIYFHCWMNPGKKSYIDVSVKVVGVNKAKVLNIFVPFQISLEEIEDISLRLASEKIAHATFSSGCIIDFMKNQYSSELAYNGKTMDIFHVSAVEPTLTHMADGTLISIEYGQVSQYIDNEDAYFSIRLPHKSLDNVFCYHKYTDSLAAKIRDMIMSPIRSEKYGYSIRVNETRKLPYEITRKGAFHRQKLRKAVVTVSMNENYEINDANCYQIRRLEEDLYRDYVPQGFCCEDVITYQWKDSVRGGWIHGQFNFYLNISHSSISIASMIAYLCLLYFINSTSGLLTSLYQYLISLFM